MKVAYLVGTYPAVSHTFVLREVVALREAGAQVDTFSIRTPSENQVLSAADRSEWVGTTYLLADRRGLLTAVLALALSAPGTLFAALRSAAAGTTGVERRLRVLAQVAEAALLERHLRARGIRHVHAHFGNNGADVARLASLVGRGRGVTWSFTMHGPAELFEITASDLARKTREASFVACISDFARSQLMALVDEQVWPRLHVVRCGIVPADWSGPLERPLTSEGLHVLCVGRLVPVKAQTLLVQAVGALAAAGHPVRLTLVGEGPGRAAIEATVARLGLADVVTLSGAVGQDEIRDWYGWAHLFALVSFAEGVPVVLMEAMASGLPVVATRIAGVAELVEDGASGLVLPPGRVEAVVAAFETLLDDGLRARMGAAGREAVAAGFDSGVQAERLRELFASLPSVTG